MTADINQNLRTTSEMELKDAHTALTSLLRKCEKAKDKLKEGSSQHSLLEGRIKALKIAGQMIEGQISKVFQTK